jgi:hypothetical protein
MPQRVRLRVGCATEGEASDHGVASDRRAAISGGRRTATPCLTLYGTNLIVYDNVHQSAQRADETSPAAPGRWGRCHLRGTTCLGPVTGREREGRADWPRERDDGGPRSVTDGPASVTPYSHCRGAQARPHHWRRVRRQRAPRPGNAHGDRRGAPEPVVGLRRRRVGVGYSARRGVRGPSPLAVGRPFIVRARPVRSARLMVGRRPHAGAHGVA